MKRNPQEMVERFRNVIASQSEDDVAAFLEDINDSVSDVDVSNYVERADYDAVVLERDAAVTKANDYRDRYINRFYEPGNGNNDVAIILGGARQDNIEREEKKVDYSSLFE